MGCCGSKEVQEKPKEVAKPPPKKATPREVVEKKIDPRIVRQQAIAKIREAPQQYSLCTAKGDVKPCFEEGLVFRIIDGDKWYFYNDTMEYDAHVEYRFGPGSEITPGPKTTVEKLDDGWTLARVVVPPLETEHFITGRVNGYKSGITLKPVDVEYLRQIAEGPNEEAAEQLRTVKELVGENADDETALRRCVETRTPFVDIAFPPTLEMLCRKGIDKRYIPPMALKRPTQYLDSSMRNQTEYFRGPVLPQCVEPGHLGDCWLMGTAATLAEKPEVVQNIFRNGTAEERAVGAYRVAVSKHGWWKNVIIDNFLPTINNVPVYGRSIDEPRELWVSFFQKAYAKLHGSYASITGGDALQALQDFTGAPTFRFDKEWEAAAKNAQTAKDLTDKLKHYSEAGYTVVLNTPGVDSETYLGSKQKDMGLDAFIAKYAEHGLQISYTYFVERVVTVSVAGKETVLLKLRNPWKVKALWNGRWANDSEEWRANPSAAALCKPKGELDHGCFWIEWKDASNYFDGGGVAFVNDSPNLVDYRIKGQFRATHPNVVLEVVAAEPVEVTLMLSQKDKRGQYIHNADANYAPLMLSVARHEGEKLRVERNTSWDPEHPSTDYNFVVSRDVAMRQTFQPGQPYLVVPRLHRRGVLEEGQTRDFVIGILANKSLEGKLKVSIRHLDESNRVFKNILTFPATGLSTAEAEHQVRVGAGLATTTVSSVVSNAAVAGLTTASEPAAESAPVDAEPAEAQPEVLTEAPEPHTNEPPQAMIPTPVNDEEKPVE